MPTLVGAWVGWRLAKLIVCQDSIVISVIAHLDARTTVDTPRLAAQAIARDSCRLAEVRNDGFVASRSELRNSCHCVPFFLHFDIALILSCLICSVSCASTTLWHVEHRPLISGA